MADHGADLAHSHDLRAGSTEMRGAGGGGGLRGEPLHASALPHDAGPSPVESPTAAPSSFFARLRSFVSESGDRGARARSSSTGLAPRAGQGGAGRDGQPGVAAEGYAPHSAEAGARRQASLLRRAISDRSGNSLSSGAVEDSGIDHSPRAAAGKGSGGGGGGGGASGHLSRYASTEGAVGFNAAGMGRSGSGRANGHGPKPGSTPGFARMGAGGPGPYGIGMHGGGGGSRAAYPSNLPAAPLARINANARGTSLMDRARGVFRVTMTEADERSDGTGSVADDTDSDIHVEASGLTGGAEKQGNGSGNVTPTRRMSLGSLSSPRGGMLQHDSAHGSGFFQQQPGPERSPLVLALVIVLVLGALVLSAVGGFFCYASLACFEHVAVPCPPDHTVIQLPVSPPLSVPRTPVVAIDAQSLGAASRLEERASDEDDMCDVFRYSATVRSAGQRVAWTACQVLASANVARDTVSGAFASTVALVSETWSSVSSIMARSPANALPTRGRPLPSKKKCLPENAPASAGSCDPEQVSQGESSEAEFDRTTRMPASWLEWLDERVDAAYDVLVALAQTQAGSPGNVVAVVKWEVYALAIALVVWIGIIALQASGSGGSSARVSESALDGEVSPEQSPESGRRMSIDSTEQAAGPNAESSAEENALDAKSGALLRDVDNELLRVGWHVWTARTTSALPSHMVEDVVRESAVVVFLVPADANARVHKGTERELSVARRLARRTVFLVEHSSTTVGGSRNGGLSDQGFDAESELLEEGAAEATTVGTLFSRINSCPDRVKRAVNELVEAESSEVLQWTLEDPRLNAESMRTMRKSLASLTGRDPNDVLNPQKLLPRGCVWHFLLVELLNTKPGTSRVHRVLGGGAPDARREEDGRRTHPAPSRLRAWPRACPPCKMHSPSLQHVRATPSLWK